MKSQILQLVAMAIFVCLITVNLNEASAQGKGGGKGGGNGGGSDGGDGGEPQLIPATYEIHTFAMPVPNANSDVQAMNNLGQVVGASDGTAFLYDPAVDYNQAFDLNTLVNVPLGYQLSIARDINDLGQITGDLVEVNGDRTWAFLIEVNHLSGPQMLVLPEPDLGVNNMRGRRINNDGNVIVAFDATGGTGSSLPPDMFHFHPGADLFDSSDDIKEILPFTRAGTFDLNSSLGSRPGQIVGKLETGEPFRYTLGDSAVEMLTDLDGANVVSRNNNHGVIVGSMDVPWRKNKTIPMSFHFDERHAEPLQTFDLTSTRPQTLNDDSDFTISSVRTIYFNHGGETFYVLNSSVFVGDAQFINDFDDAMFTSVWDLTNRGALGAPGASDFPAMCGDISVGGQTQPFVLIPIAQ